MWSVPSRTSGPLCAHVRSGAPGSRAAGRGPQDPRELLDRAAAQGRLRVPVATAAELVSAAGVGTTLRLISMTEDERDPELAARVRDRVLAVVSAEQPAADGGVATHAVALRAALEERSHLLGDAETALMVQWLDRVAAA